MDTPNTANEQRDAVASIVTDATVNAHKASSAPKQLPVSPTVAATQAIADAQLRSKRVGRV